MVRTIEVDCPHCDDDHEVDPDDVDLDGRHDEVECPNTGDIYLLFPDDAPNGGSA